jgi:hypothetical protein
MALGDELTAPAATVAYPAAFYSRIAIDVELTGDALVAALTGFTNHGANLLRVRVMRPPSTCSGMAGEELWTGLAGEEAEFGLEKIGADGTNFFQAVTGIDFGGIDLVNGRLQASWYECPGATAYALFRDVEADHFLLTDDGEPFLAWSIARP